VRKSNYLLALRFSANIPEFSHQMNTGLCAPPFGHDIKVLLDGMLFTGMRGEEFWRFLQHPEWFDHDRGVIHLPPAAVLKKKAKQKERDIYPSNWGLTVIERLFDYELRKISRISWRATLIRASKRANLSPEGITLKMTRKTWESWLVASYPAMTLQIALSQGHSSLTALNHYVNIAFS